MGGSILICLDLALSLKTKQLKYHSLRFESYLLPPAWKREGTMFKIQLVTTLGEKLIPDPKFT